MERQRYSKEELKEFLCIKELAEKYGANGWKSAGENKFLGLCPFHNDTDPSLLVDLNKNTFKCFGSCGEPTYGDVFTLIAKGEGLDCHTNFSKILEVASREV